MVPSAEALVVDASVAVKWHLTDEPDADRAARLYEAFLEGRIMLRVATTIEFMLRCKRDTRARRGVDPRPLPGSIR